MRIISTFQATHRIILWQWTSTVDIVVNVDPRRHQVQVVVEVKEEVQVVEMNDSIRFTLCSCPSAALHVTVGAKIPITGNRKKSNIL